MREILFRAKRIDNGEWVEGYLVKQFGIYKIYNDGEKDFGEWIHEVDPATVGQFTGLHDKHGKRIFEGDIVCTRYANFYTPIFRNGIYMAYNIQDLHLDGTEPSTQFNIVWKEGCEVIGIIHDKEMQP